MSPSDFLSGFIERLRTKLLDISGRNNLISFRHSEKSRKQLPLIDSSLDVVFELLEGEKPLKVLPLPLPYSEPQDEQTPQFQSALERAKNEDEIYLIGIKALGNDPPKKPLQALEAALRDRLRVALGMHAISRGKLVSKEDHAQSMGISPSYTLETGAAGRTRKSASEKRIQTLLYPEELERKMSAIHEQARLSETETGLNTLFASFGFLEWYEREDSEKPIYSPLLLYALEISREISKDQYQYSIVSRGDELAENICLRERLKRDFAIQLPDLREDEKPESYLLRISKLIERDHPTWKVHRRITIAFFSFAKLVMYHDLDPAVIGNVDEDNPLFTLVQGEEVTETAFAEDHAIDSEEIQKKIKTLIHDADASQTSALVDVIDGKNLVIQGPPGTGKSQTITNIIAGALQAGKSVLFVAEKRAALEVVKKRLDNAGLGDFVLELHSNKTKKTDVLQSLHKRDQLRNSSDPERYLESVIANHRRIKETITEYVNILNSEFGSLGESIHSILWKILRLRDELGDSPLGLDDIAWEKAGSTTKSDIETHRLLLDVLEKYSRTLEAYPLIQDHPWYGFAHASQGSFETKRLRELIGAALRSAQVFESVIEQAPHMGSSLQPLPVREVSGLLKRIGASAELFLAVIEPRLMAPASQPENGKALRQAISDFRKLQEVDREIVASMGASLDANDKDAIERLAVTLRQLLRMRLGESLIEQLPENIARETAVLDDWLQLRDFLNVLQSRVHYTGALSFQNASTSLVAIQAATELDASTLQFRDASIFRPESRAILERGAAMAAQLRPGRDELTRRFILDGEVPISDIDIASSTLSDRSLFRFFRREFWAARGFYYSLARDKVRVSSREMSVKLGELSQYRLLIKQLDGDGPLRTLLGTRYCGIDSNFPPLIHLNEWAKKVSDRLPGYDECSSVLKHFLLEASADDIQSFRDIQNHPQFGRFVELISTGKETPRRLVIQHLTEIEANIEQLKGAEILASRLDLVPTLKIAALGPLVDSLRSRTKLLLRIQENTFANRALANLFPLTADTLPVINSTLDYIDNLRSISLPEGAAAEFFTAASQGRFEELVKWSGVADPALTALYASISDISTLLPEDSRAVIRSLDENSLRFILDRLSNAIAHEDELDSFIDYLKCERDVESQGLSPILDAFRSRSVSFNNLPTAYEYSLYRHLLKLSIADFPLLARSVGLQFDELRRRFLKVDEELIGLYRRQLFADLCSRPVSRGVGKGRPSDKSELGLVRHEISKQRKHLAIRVLLSRAARAIQEMKPCFMMSPLSVAQYLPPGCLDFDLVVMDEASQLRPEDAMGAVMRGKQVVVVGDPKQLPPTNFFNFSDIIVETDDYNPDLDSDHESVLDLAMKSFQAPRRLKWHYRSKHESLIAFSNDAFYNNDLIVFPSPYHSDEKHGVKFIAVNGTYQGHTNMKEAQAIVEQTAAFAAANPKLSLGIVAMNQPQRDLIAELLDEKTKRDPSLQSYRGHWEKTLEPLFVKNLENVQGDERDVIFISTVYGKDPAGNLFQRFGPVNGPMGHRRLNVLFTRSKWQMRIFSSLDPDSIAVDSGSSEGLRALKGFLDYARTGRLQSSAPVTTGRGPDSDFETFVERHLKNHGYNVVRQVGVAGYFIDLAVTHPAHEGIYALGIECDGATYHSAKSARDRDKTRQEILENLGWRIHRIWSTDWFHNTDREKKKLLAALPPIVRRAEGRTEPATTTPAATEPSPQSTPATGEDLRAETRSSNGEPFPDARILEAIRQAFSKGKLLRAYAPHAVAENLHLAAPDGSPRKRIQSLLDSEIRAGRLECDMKYIWRKKPE